MASFGFRVFGEPSPQGSKIPGVSSKTGKKFVRDQGGQKLKDWRKAVTEAARVVRAALHPEQMIEEGVPTFGKEVAVSVQIVLYVPRPPSVPVRKRALPSVKPDLDKMIRAILDAMKDALVYKDDGQVVKIWAIKQYAVAGVPDAEPGAWITLTDQLD